MSILALSRVWILLDWPQGPGGRKDIASGLRKCVGLIARLVGFMRNLKYVKANLNPNFFC